MHNDGNRPFRPIKAHSLSTSSHLINRYIHLC
uniref:Uncharacterized protein n=1 Tax=Anguilla anguilla TaxID=7936 RepID=A0A0E9Q7S4_ANGAN